MAASDDQARPLYEQAMILARDVADDWLLSAAVNNLGGVYLDEGNYERAIELFEESLAIGEARGDLDRRARELTMLGYATRGLGNLGPALEYLRDGLIAAEEIGLVGTALNAICGVAFCEMDNGDIGSAARLWGWIETEISRLGAPREAYDLALEESLRGKLDPRRFASETAAGKALTRADAIDLALGRSR